MGYIWANILSLFTYLLTTSVSGRVPGYPSYYPAGTRVINYPDTAALPNTQQRRMRRMMFDCPRLNMPTVVFSCPLHALELTVVGRVACKHVPKSKLQQT